MAHTRCPNCDELREIPEPHTICMNCWEENGEPHPSDERGVVKGRMF